MSLVCAANWGTVNDGMVFLSTESSNLFRRWGCIEWTSLLTQVKYEVVVRNSMDSRRKGWEGDLTFYLRHQQQKDASSTYHRAYFSTESDLEQHVLAGAGALNKNIDFGKCCAFDTISNRPKWKVYYFVGWGLTGSKMTVLRGRPLTNTWISHANGRRSN